MKKLVIMSDNHGDMNIMSDIRVLEPDADLYIHCGDSEATHKMQLEGFVCVAGNNDWGLDLPRFAKLKVEGVSILITHGQFYGYFDREKHMIKDLKKHGCTLMFSGHTHMPSIKSEGKYTFINPGSTSWPRGGSKRSYAVVTLDDGQITSAKIKEL
ncbi:MAG TPA: YfcE family phosphodiesterase [Erysipelotrichaceae bacterium]|nr:YfcE family phosphodiesterase [Erysipelotrichaceae bacterium]